VNPPVIPSNVEDKDSWQESIQKWHQLLQGQVKSAWHLFVFKEIAGALGSGTAATIKSGSDIVNEIARLTQNNQEQNQEWTDLIYVCDHLLPGRNGAGPDAGGAFLAWERARGNQSARGAFLQSMEANTPTQIVEAMRQINASALGQFASAVNNTIDAAPRWLMAWRVLTQRKQLDALDKQANRLIPPDREALQEAESKFRRAERESTQLLSVGGVIAVILFACGILGSVAFQQGWMEQVQGMFVAMGSATLTATSLSGTPTTEKTAGPNTTATSQPDVTPIVNPTKEPEPTKTSTPTPTNTTTPTATATQTQTPTLTTTQTQTVTVTATGTPTRTQPARTRTPTPTSASSGQAQVACGGKKLLTLTAFSIANANGAPFQNNSFSKDEQFQFRFTLCNGTSAPITLSNIEVRFFVGENKDIAKATPESVTLEPGQPQTFTTDLKKTGRETYSARIFYTEAGIVKDIVAGQFKVD